MTTVAILGAGPSGLTAAHAAAPFANTTVFSRRQRSPIHGSQYLHEPIPGITCDAAETQYTMWGNPDNYLRRVYGEDADLGGWTDAINEKVMAHDMRQTYRALWGMYHPIISDTELDPVVLRWIVRNFDIVISTIPSSWTCLDPRHRFRYSYIWAAGETEDGIIRLDEVVPVPDNTIIRNGLDHNTYNKWTRAARHFGVMTVEWPANMDKPWPTASLVGKPVKTDCDCWPGVHRIGRYGAFDKDALVHMAYEQTIEIITQGDKAHE